MQLIALEDGRILCPACGATLEEVMEQTRGDRRILIVLHPLVECKWRAHMMRVDRRTGYSEEMQQEAKHAERA